MVKTVAVVGDGAVGVLGVLAARQLAADRIIFISRHEDRQKLALDYDATDVVTERGQFTIRPAVAGAELAFLRDLVGRWHAPHLTPFEEAESKGGER